MTTTMSTKRLRIAVQGAGITGPAAALALASAGHDVTVYEARRQNEVWSPGVVRITSEVMDQLDALGVPNLSLSEPGKDRRITIEDGVQTTDWYEFPEGYHNVVWGEMHASVVSTAHQLGAQFHWETPLPDGERWDAVVHSAGVSYALHKVRAGHQKFERLGYTAFRANTSVPTEVPWTAIKGLGNFILNLAETRQGFTHFILYLREEPGVEARTVNLSPGRRLDRVYEQVQRFIPAEFQPWLNPERMLTPLQASPLSYWTMPLSIWWNGEDYDDFGVHVDAGDAIAPVSPHTGMGANLGIQEALNLPDAFASQEGLDAWVKDTTANRDHQNQVGRERVRSWMHI